MYVTQIIVGLSFWIFIAGCRTEPSDRNLDHQWTEVKIVNSVPEENCGYPVDRMDEFRDFSPKQVQDVFERRIPFIPRGVRSHGQFQFYFCVDEYGNLKDVRLILLDGVLSSECEKMLISAVEWMVEELQKGKYSTLTKDGEPAEYHFMVRMEFSM